jgi:hypothetical protein
VLLFTPVIAVLRQDAIPHLLRIEVLGTLYAHDTVTFPEITVALRAVSAIRHIDLLIPSQIVEVQWS